MSNVIGKVILIGNTEEVGQNGFTKRMLVVETDEQYSQKIAIDFVKDKTSILDKYKIGDAVNVSINLRGSEYNGRYFVNLQGWRIEAAGLDAKEIATLASAAIAAVKSFTAEEEQSDLPF